jgi:hypothetical protein
MSCIALSLFDAHATDCLQEVGRVAAGCAADKAAVARHENIIQRMLFTSLRGQTKVMFFNNQEEIFDSIDSMRGLIR